MQPVSDKDQPPADPVVAAYRVIQRATRERKDTDQPRVIFEVTGPPAPNPTPPESEAEPQ